MMVRWKTIGHPRTCICTQTAGGKSTLPPRLQKPLLVAPSTKLAWKDTIASERVWLLFGFRIELPIFKNRRTVQRHVFGFVSYEIKAEWQRNNRVKKGKTMRRPTD
eukprot:scaffold8211_cov117-Cylindrotheca_fusiformis.AAC.11